MKKIISLIILLLLVFSATVYAEEALWSQKFSEDYAQSVTLPAVWGDYLYSAVNSTVLKIDPETGEAVQRAEILQGETGYAINPPTADNGILYFGVGKGTVQAVSADEIKSLWTGGAKEGQTLSPVTVSDGLVFTGTWRGEMRDGEYFCLSAEDGSLLWSITHKGGFYRAGAYKGEGYLLFGSDDGSANVTDGAVLYSVNPETGEIIDRAEGIFGDIRSSVCVDNGFVYFTTKGKRLYRIKLEEGGFLGDAEFCELGGMSTSTPVTHNGIAYVGVSGKTTFDKDGHCMKLIDTQTLEIITSSVLPGYPQTEGVLVEKEGVVTVYTTCNNPPGGIYAVSFDGSNAECYTVFEPEGEMAEHCISGVVLYNGRLYYKNDSGYVFCVKPDELVSDNKPAAPLEPEVAPPDTSVNSTIGVYVTLEKFTLGAGFIIEPVFLELPEGARASDAIVKAIEENLGADSYISTGSADSGFYLSYVRDEQGEEDIPQYILTAAGGNIGGRADRQYLGEFDYTDEAGWMYCVNNEFPDVGASEYTVENKDVIRWQFTLVGKGADLGADNTRWGGGSIVEAADKDKLIKRIAEINSVEAFDKLMQIEENRTGYDNAMAVLTNLQSSQVVVDAAYDKIKTLKKTTDADIKQEEKEQEQPEEKPVQEKEPLFTDIDGHWGEDYIVKLWQMGFISGRSDSIFDPDAPVSRGELMVMLHRISGDKEKYTPSFSDIFEGDYYFGAVGWAQLLGIAGGMEENMFCPKIWVSREMAAAFLHRFSRKMEYRIEKTSKRVLFSDHKKISDWAQEAVNEMVSAGILSGRTDGSFSPSDNTTRAECACMIYKLLEGRAADEV